MLSFDPRILPGVMISISILAAVIYGGVGDWRRCFYWIAAAVITWTVTF